MRGPPRGQRDGSALTAARRRPPDGVVSNCPHNPTIAWSTTISGIRGQRNRPRLSLAPASPTCRRLSLLALVLLASACRGRGTEAKSQTPAGPRLASLPSRLDLDVLVQDQPAQGTRNVAASKRSRAAIGSGGTADSGGSSVMSGSTNKRGTMGTGGGARARGGSSGALVAVVARERALRARVEQPQTAAREVAET